MAQQGGILIVLNGASSSGKTSTAQALGAILGTQCVHTGFDDILDRVQPFGPENAGRIGQLLRSMRISWFRLTDGRLRLFKRLHQEVVALVQAGHTVIMDTALMDRRALQDAAARFAPLGGFLIGMKPPLAVSEQWEAARADRPPGQARQHYDLIHAHDIYDLLLDPSKMPPHECARAILQHIQAVPPSAFCRLLDSSFGAQ
jgi:chloramphenicol 3-O phosphotransferase